MPTASSWSERFSNDLYRSLWRFMVPYLKVPADPPDLPPQVPGGEQDALEVFQPAAGFLSYMKFWFWIVAIIIDLSILALWIIIGVANIFVGLLLFPIMLVIMFLPDVIAFVAIHVRYDTTWYAMTDRAIRMRRGVWIIHETTISFENVQNVKVTQGPLQRHFGIANVVIETAGSGGGSHGKHAFGVTNQGLIEGIGDAQRVRDLILERMRTSKGTGLGDDDDVARGRDAARRAHRGWSKEHIDVLREIRDALPGAR